MANQKWDEISFNTKKRVKLKKCLIIYAIFSTFKLYICFHMSSVRLSRKFNKKWVSESNDLMKWQFSLIDPNKSLHLMLKQFQWHMERHTHTRSKTHTFSNQITLFVLCALSRIGWMWKCFICIQDNLENQKRINQWESFKLFRVFMHTVK